MVVCERETVKERREELWLVVVGKEKDEKEERGKSELVRSFLLGRTG